MIWSCFLHFYQPPTQKKYWIDRITNESYRRIVKGLLENPSAKITLNINSVLCELWEENGHTDVLDGLKTLIHRGQVELTGSAKFHPLLPKLPEEMVVRQILLNEITLNKYFGVVGPAYSAECRALSDKVLSSSQLNANRSPLNASLRGFFPPEMAYNRYLAQIVADLGYGWIIAEELSLGRKVEYDRIYEVSGIIARNRHAEFSSASDPNEVVLNQVQNDGGAGQPLKIFFRDRGFSYKILAGYLGTQKLFLGELEQRFSKIDSRSLNYLLTAMDGETFGHHRPGMEKLLFDLFKIPEIQMVHVSDLPKLFPKREAVETVPSTWALMEHEVEKNLPFARWDDPENEVHRLQWELTNLAIGVIQKAKIKMQSDNLKFKVNPAERDTEILNFDLLTLNLSGEGLNNLSEEEGSLMRAQNLLDRALHSDQYWWASAKPWWSIEYIERGAKEFLEAIRSTGLKTESKRAQELYYKILETAFEYQRSGKVDEISRKEDETIRMRTDQTLPKMPKEELLKIIKTIREEMLSVAGSQEYERAAQLRDRIKELETYLS